MNNYTRIRALVAVLLAATFLACIQEKGNQQVAGGDDYPNTVDALGKKTAKALGDSADWNGFDSIPKGGPGLYDEAVFPNPDLETTQSDWPSPPPAMGHLAKKAAPVDTIRTVDTIFTGEVRTVIHSISDSLREVDTTLMIPADPAIPGSLPGFSLVVHHRIYSNSERFESFRFVDADGDGYITPRSGSVNIVEREFTEGFAGGVIERSVQQVAAGGDLDFNGMEDNRLVANLFIRTLGQDTLDAYRFADPEGDSALIDNTREINLVDLFETHRLPVGNTLAKVERKVRIAANSRDSSKSRPVRYSERRFLRDGSTVDVSVKGPSADSAFQPGEDVIWTESTARPTSDSVESSSVAWTVRLAPSPGAHTANTLLAFTAEEKVRGGKSDFRFEFVGESPTADGRWISKGEVVSSLASAKGVRTDFTGRSDSTGFSGTVTWEGYPSHPVSFDRSGNTISKP